MDFIKVSGSFNFKIVGNLPIVFDTLQLYYRLGFPSTEVVSGFLCYLPSYNFWWSYNILI